MAKSPAFKLNSLSAWVEILLYLFIFVFPWQTRWIIGQNFCCGGVLEFETLGLYISELVLWALLIVYGIQLLHAARPVRRRWTWNAAAVFFISTLGFIVLSAGSVAWASHSQLAIFSAFRVVEAMAFGTLLMNFAFPRQRLLWTLVTTGCIQAVLGGWQFATQAVWGSKWLGLSAQSAAALLGESVIETGTGRFLRAYGSFPHRNILGGFLALCALAALYLLVRARRSGESLIALVCLLVITFGLFLTFSRSALIAFIVAAVLFLANDFLEQKKSGPATLAAMAFLAAALFFGIVYQDLSVSRLRPASRLEARSLSERTELVHESAQVISRYRWWGTGIGNYTRAVRTELAISKNAWQYQPVHNVFLLIWAELGIFGLIFFVSLIVSALWHAVARRSWIAVSLISALCILFFLDHYPWSLYPGLLMVWTAIGLGLGLNRTRT